MCEGCFGQRRNAERARRLLLSHLVCLGRHSVSGLICAGARQWCDWSADYRLFGRGRIDAQAMLGVIQRQVEGDLQDTSQPLVTAMDDSILRKRGRQIHGAGWRRDPLSPPFHVNFAWGQRVVQISAALPVAPGQARMIPIDFAHAVPPAKAPRRCSPEALEACKEQARQRNINRQALERLELVRRRTDPRRPLWSVVDGRFTNRTILKHLPADTTLIGRIRKDAKLYARPAQSAAAGPGRRRVYGEEQPTPEQVLAEASIPWQNVSAFAAGKFHQFRVKTLAPVRWRTAGECDLRLIAIAPLAYHRSKQGKTLYRQPAYLICTDPDLPIQEVLQAYLWRWDIEVNFRDEKTLLGVGQAQVRTAEANSRLPAAAVAAYSLLLLAAARTYGPLGRPDQLPPPRWRKPQKLRRTSTAQLINQLRYDLWGQAIGGRGAHHFSDFSSPPPLQKKPHKWLPDLQSAVFYAMA
jgi:hypothetical protein